MTRQEKIDFCKSWITKLNGQYDKLNMDRETSLKFINGDPSIVALVKGRSELVTTDIEDAISIALPDILESIAGTDEPMKLDPTGAEDVEPVKKLQILGNIMVRRKNPWFRRCSDFLQDSMKLKLGVFKYQWISETKTIEKTYQDLTDIELSSLLEKEGVRIVSDEGAGSAGRATVIGYDQYDEYVKLDVVPAERIRFPLDTRDFETAVFVVEEVQLYKPEFIRQYGREAFDAVEKEKKAFEMDSANNVLEQRYKDVGGISFFYDKESDKYKAYECYFWEEDEEKPWMFCFAGDYTIIDEANKYGKPPYRGGSPFLLAHRLIGNGYFDVLKEIQRQRTYLRRQIFDNVTMTNYRRYFVDDSRLNMTDYLNNYATNAAIRCSGDPNTIVRPEDKAPLPPELLQFDEMLLIDKDYHSPTPRSYQGVNPQVLNKTYRGQNQQVQQASKKLLMMIRAYMEDVFAPLFGDVVDCILRFIKKSTSVRYLNEDYDVSPDNIIGRYDLIVNVGLGAQDKNDVIIKLQQLIGLMNQQIGMGTGVITPQNIQYAMSELVKAMGFLNTTDFVTDPKIKEMVQALIQEMTMLIQAFPPSPESQQLFQNFTQMATQVMAALGVQPEGTDKGGENTSGTFPGQEPAAIPDQAINPMWQRDRADGGNFYA